MNFGLLGPGSIARKFADACSRTEGVKLLAVASGSRERAEAFAAEFEVENVCGSYEELLALPEIDAVYISVINSLHYETARKCLEAGKAVLCEKPFCVTVSQTEELIRLAEEKGLLLMEGMWTLFLPCVCAVRNWVKDWKAQISGQQLFLLCSCGSGKPSFFRVSRRRSGFRCGHLLPCLFPEHDRTAARFLPVKAVCGRDRCG